LQSNANAALRLDLAAPDQADRKVYDDPPAVAVVCAAIAKVDFCRDQPEYTAGINVEGTKYVCRRLAESGCRIIFLSTNQVFDGLHPNMPPEAVPSPLSEYGRQKAEVEQFLTSISGQHAIVRLSKVLAGRPAIFERWLNDWRSSRVVEAFVDLFWAPVPLDFVVTALSALSESSHTGIFQISAKEETSYADTAYRVAESLEIDRALVRAVTMAEAGLTLYPANRHCTLDASHLERELGLSPPDLWRCIEDSLAGIGGDHLQL
jgi:dTDP-4-dehydrorhamnose reductase